MTAKSTPTEIRERFDADVERFANLETGQAATMDAPLTMELVIAAALATVPAGGHVLDLGCGAGNYSLKVLERRPGTRFTLVDLSRPMLDRAVQRIEAAGGAVVDAIQGDLRDIDLGEQRYDAAMAAAVLHHLREASQWRAVFAGIFRSLRPGGGLWISDLVTHDTPAVRDAMWARFGEHLTTLGGPAYRDKAFAYIEREDSPRSVAFQLDVLAAAGFVDCDVLHANACFAAFGGRRPLSPEGVTPASKAS